MPKRSKKQIENDEAEILQELAKKANISINEIAKKCGFSRQKVWRIIKRLEKNNTIWGYVTVIGHEAQGLKCFSLLVKKTNQPISETVLENITKRKLEKMADKIGVSIECSAYMNGVYDWIIRFTCQDIKQAKKFCEVFNITYKGYIQELELLEEMFPIKINGIVNPEVEKLREFVEI